MRLFGSERIAKVMDRSGAEEGEVITHPLVTRAIESAQKRVEYQNFQCEEPQRVDHLALLVHHVVIVQQPLTGLEVLVLEPAKRSTGRSSTRWSGITSEDCLFSSVPPALRCRRRWLAC